MIGLEHGYKWDDSNILGRNSICLLTNCERNLVLLRSISLSTKMKIYVSPLMNLRRDSTLIRFCRFITETPSPNTRWRTHFLWFQHLFRQPISKFVPSTMQEAKDSTSRISILSSMLIAKNQSSKEEISEVCTSHSKTTRQLSSTMDQWMSYRNNSPSSLKITLEKRVLSEY